MKVRALAIAALVLLLVIAVGGSAATGDDRLTAPRAALLGVVEGTTEFVPVSSTGHLIVVDHVVSGEEADDEATKGFLVAVQAGAIAAVIGVYRRRIGEIVLGIWRGGPGRRLANALVVATAPAVAAGAIAGDAIKGRLFEPLPVAAALSVGGAAILVANAWYRRHEERPGRALEQLDLRTAALIGVAQVAALWPGVSRSLVTLVAALALGLSVRAAVEFSFLLGAVVLSLATAYELTGGSGGVGGVGAVTVGLLSAFVSALVAVRWMVRYLERRDLAVFGWYRVVVGAVTVGFVVTGVVHG